MRCSAGSKARLGCGVLTPLHFAFGAALGSTSISGARNVETGLFVFILTAWKLKFPRCPFILTVFDLKTRKIRVANWLYKSWVTGNSGSLFLVWCRGEGKENFWEVFHGFLQIPF